MSLNPLFSDLFSDNPFSPFDESDDSGSPGWGARQDHQPDDGPSTPGAPTGDGGWSWHAGDGSGGPDHGELKFFRFEGSEIGSPQFGDGGLHDPVAAKPGGTPGGGNGGGGGGNGGNGGDPVPTGPTDPWFTYISGEADSAGTDHFNIQVEFYGLESDWLSPLLGASDTANWYIDAFIAAADYLSSIITTGFATDFYPGSYFDGTQETRYADDIVIEVYLEDIDGAGGILGQAGPTFARDADGDGIIDGMPTAGIMQFDVADAEVLLIGGQIVPGVTIDGGVWFDTVLHEMMHVIGFGSLWGVTEESPDFDWDLVGDGLTWDSDNGTRRPSDDEYHYDYLGGANAVAGETLGVEANGGSGTARGHWDELLYGNEIMTGYINTAWDPTVDSSTGTDVGSYNYMAAFTVAALKDLGYTLDGSMSYQQLANLGNDVLMMDDVWGMAA